MNKQTVAILTKIALISIFVLTSFESSSIGENWNFKSQQEQDAFIAATLKKIAIEINSQTPIQIDQDTRMMSVISIGKTLNYYMILNNYKSSQLNPIDIENSAKEILNDAVCKNKSTRDLIDMGVKYRYNYRGNDNKFVTNVVIDYYGCK